MRIKVWCTETLIPDGYVYIEAPGIRIVKTEDSALEINTYDQEANPLKWTWFAAGAWDVIELEEDATPEMIAKFDAKYSPNKKQGRQIHIPRNVVDPSKTL
jgi:hypothetical protein